eukprot:s2778_g5.t1
MVLLETLCRRSGIRSTTFLFQWLLNKPHLRALQKPGISSFDGCSITRPSFSFNLTLPRRLRSMDCRLRSGSSRQPGLRASGLCVTKG